MTHSFLRIAAVFTAFPFLMLPITAADAPAPKPPEPSATAPIPTPEQIKAMAALLPANPAGVGRPITDRAAWTTAASQPAFQKEVKDAATFATQPIPELTDALFNDVLVTGHRETYEKPFRARTTRLVAFVIAEGVQNQGTYLPLIEKELDTILNEKSWAVPSHVLLSKPYGGIEKSIDLATAVRAWTLATTDYMLGDKLQPQTRQRIRDEIKKRVFDGYEDAVRTGNAHWGWMTGKNNWNAVCNSGVVGAALALIPSPEERALVVCGAQNYLKNYIDGFPADGYDEEGMGYWGYGFGNYLCLSETIYQATQGKVNMLAGPKIRQIALFPRHFEIIDGVFPTFGDSGVVKAHGIEGIAGPSLMQYINQRWGMNWTDLDPAKADMYAQHPLGDRLGGFGLFGFPLPVYNGNIVIGSPATPEEAKSAALRYFFKDNCVLLTRSTKPGAARLGLALKGGKNLGGHGHNDNGTYVVVCNGEALVVDPGMEAYNAKTFGPHRYEVEMMNSFGHDVPYVGDTLQSTGDAATAPITSTTFTDDKDTVVMDLTGSYAVPNLKRLTRTYVLDRTKPSVEITDTATFNAPTDFGSALVTISSYNETGTGKFLIYGKTSAVQATVTVSNGTLVDKVEPITGHMLPKNFFPMRLGINLSAPVKKVTMHTVIVPAALPAAPPAVDAAPAAPATNAPPAAPAPATPPAPK